MIRTGKLVGILTNRDLRFEDDPKRKVSEVMTKENLYTAPEGTDLKKAEQLFKKTKVEKLPIVNKQGKLSGLFTYSDILKLKSHPNAVKDSFGRLLVGAGVGITRDMMDRVDALQKVGVDVICLDSAHGHSKGVISALKDVKKNFKNINVIAGNVGTAAGAKAVAEAGADAVKVGIGPGFDLYNTNCCRCRCTATHCGNGSMLCIKTEKYSVNCRWWYSLYR